MSRLGFVERKGGQRGAGGVDRIPHGQIDYVSNGVLCARDPLARRSKSTTFRREAGSVVCGGDGEEAVPPVCCAAPHQKIVVVKLVLELILVLIRMGQRLFFHCRLALYLP